MITETAALATDVAVTEAVSAVRKRKAPRKVPVAAEMLPATDSLPKLSSKDASASATARRNRQFFAGAFISTIAVVATAVSVTHLSHGIRFVTHCPQWEAWALAGVIDLGFVGFKACDIVGYTADARHANQTWGKWCILATVILSAILNALTFSNNVEGLTLKIGACALGCFVPCIIMGAFKVGSAHLIRRTA